MKVNYLGRVSVWLHFRDVRIVDVEHVIANHLLSHSTGTLCHLQHELVQVGTYGRTPEAPFAQKLVLNGRPLLGHILQGVLLPLKDVWTDEV